MRHVLIFILCICSAPNTIFGQSFYDIDSINTIHITFSQSNWDYLLDSLVSVGDDRLIAQSVSINGESFDSVGVRFKGNSSYQSSNAKNPLNIKLSHIIDQDYEGYQTFKLSSGFKDPTFAREIYAYEIARKYMPAPEANLVNVYINGNLYGLFTNVEAVNKDFLSNFFSSEDHILFKCDGQYGVPPQPGCIGGGGSGLSFKGLDSACYFNHYELKRDYGWNALTNAIDVLNNNSSQVQQAFNVDRALWMLAFNNVLLNFDSYTGSRHNYYIYMDKNERFHTILWDLNEAFGSFPMAGSGPPMSINDMKNLDPLHNSNSFQHPLIQKLLANDEYKKSYMAHLRTIFSENFNNAAYSSRLNYIKAVAEPAVIADPNKLFSYQDFLNNYNNNVGSIPGLNDLMSGRVGYLNANPEMNKQAPTISVPLASNNSPQVNDTVWIQTTVTNATRVVLRYRYATYDVFVEQNMLDDGTMQDVAAADGIYGSYLVVPATGVQYYIYAENNDAAMFSPERAAYEFYSLSTSSGLVPASLVINELCTSNDSVMPDANGEYDDWIELYNNTNAPINLLGLYLSDDFSNTSKWAFPDTVIAANDYLMIWADNDLSQPGLHAGFKLSSSGEALAIFDNSGSFIDSVTFYSQSTDITYGRFPNGIGPYQMMSPTFSAQNVDNTSIHQLPKSISNWRLYPNPTSGDQLSLELQLQQDGVFELFVSNALGQYIWSDKYYWNRGTHTTNIPVATLEAGIYTVCIMGNEGMLSKRFVKR